MFIYMFSNTPRKFCGLPSCENKPGRHLLFFYIYFDGSRETENDWIGKKGMVLMMC